MKRAYDKSSFRTGEGRRHGVSLVEMLAVLLILSFIVACAARLFYTGRAQNRMAGGYSQAQTDLGTALRRVTRTIRHGYALTHTSIKANFPANSTTNATQILVPIPETDADGTHKEIRIYYANGALYSQRSDTNGAGIQMITGLRTVPAGVDFRYYINNNGVLTEVAAQPEQATDIQITLTTARGTMTTSAAAHVALRNKLLGP